MEDSHRPHSPAEVQPWRVGPLPAICPLTLLLDTWGYLISRLLFSLSSNFSPTHLNCNQNETRKAQKT